MRKWTKMIQKTGHKEVLWMQLCCAAGWAHAHAPDVLSEPLGIGGWAGMAQYCLTKQLWFHTGLSKLSKLLSAVPASFSSCIPCFCLYWYIQPKWFGVWSGPASLCKPYFVSLLNHRSVSLLALFSPRPLQLFLAWVSQDKSDVSRCFSLSYQF